MNSIKILIYTDESNFSVDPCAEFGISELKRMIRFKTACVVDVHIDLINRHFDSVAQRPVHAINKLTVEFLDQYDEVWFFGFRQTNLPESAEPENELIDKEIDALKNWMKTGGVLISGDHANEDPSIPDDHPDKKNHATYLSLGRALGIGVPRARHLRVWKGPPTADDEDKKKPIADRDNRNTQEGADIQTLDLPKHQSDAVPQHLLLAKRLQPHKLFWWYVDEHLTLFPIVKLPDHMHEGALSEPSSFDADEWPGTCKPQVIAWGTDKRFDLTFYGLISAYEGDSNAGRIVADSSWHHYLNINLMRFPRDAAGNPPFGSDLDQIAQYYANLAIWLAPKEIRKGLGFDIIFELAKSPQVLEVKNADVSILGDTARAVLDTKVGRSNLYRLFAQSSFENEPEVDDRLFELAFLSNISTHPGPMDDMALVGATIQSNFLGTLIRKYHRDLETAGIVDFDTTANNLLSVTRSNRLLAAFEEQKSLIQDRLRGLADLTNALWPEGGDGN